MGSKSTPTEGKVPSISALARACGVARTTVQAWQADPEFPGQMDGGGFDVFEVGKWKGAKEEAKKPRLSGDEDPLLASGDSPGLERYRMAKAQMAELDLGLRQGQLLPVEMLDVGLTALTDAYRRGIETAQRLYGSEIIPIFEESFARGKDVIDQHFGSHVIEEGEADETTDGA